MTLAQGLEEYYTANAAKVTRSQWLEATSRPLFLNHDICHVIFGLDTSLQDESVVDIRTVVSSDVGWRRYLAASVSTLPRLRTISIASSSDCS